MWHFLLLLIDNFQAKGEKVEAIAILLGDSTSWQSQYARIVCLLETPKPIHQLKKKLESGKPLLLPSEQLNITFILPPMFEFFLLVPKYQPHSMLSESEVAILKLELGRSNDKWPMESYSRGEQP